MSELSKIRALSAPLFWLLAWTALIAAMLQGLHGGFLFDDFPNIVENQAVRLTSLGVADLRHSLDGPAAGPLGRPLSVLSFALTHYAFGLDPFAFKAINLAIHAFNGLLVTWLVALLLRAVRDPLWREPNIRILAWWIAAAWLLHPINVIPVLLAVQRMTLLATSFLLLALICHLRALDAAPRSQARWALLAVSWLLFWPLSVLSKETGALFPVYVFVIHGTVRPLPGWRLRHTAGVALVASLAFAAGVFLSRHWLESAYALRPFTLTERLMTEARVLWFYAAQIVLPNPTSFAFYLDDFPVSTGLIAPPTTLAAIAGWAAVIAALLFGKRRHPVLCLATAWFLGGHLLESTFVPLEIAQEYRNYLPSVGLILGAGYLGSTLLAKARLDHRTLTTALAAILPVAMLAMLTWLRANQWSDPVLGPQIEVARHPLSARANQAAALALVKAGYGGAGDMIGGQLVRFHLEQASAVNASFKAPSLQLIFWACASGRQVDRAWIDGLASRLEHTTFEPGDFQLSEQLLQHTLAQLQCLSQTDALKLFLAGAHNTGIAGWLRAGFLEAASDYTLLVIHDPIKAQNYLTQASTLWPENAALRKKLKSFQVMHLEEHREH